MRQLVFTIVICSLFTGCTQSNPSDHAVDATPLREDSGLLSNPTVAGVREVISEQKDIALKRVTPLTSLSELGVDDLDYVEITMTLEEKLSISIPDETTEALLEGKELQEGLKNVTVQKLAALVDKLVAVGRSPSEPVSPNGGAKKS
jgi:acyl carrier protein